MCKMLPTLKSKCTIISGLQIEGKLDGSELNVLRDPGPGWWGWEG